jgi:hypothetical protein
VQHTQRVAFKLLNLDHGWVLPQSQLVPSKLVRRQNLLLVWIPLKSTDLRLHVNGVQEGVRPRVPKLDGPIGSTTTPCQEIPFMRRPGHSFDRSLMVRQFKGRSSTRRSGDTPHAQLVVIATTRKRITLPVPL